MRIVARKSQVFGEISVPGSKSHTIRAVAVATMAKGRSIIRHPLLSGDTFSSLKAARTLGANVFENSDHWAIDGIGGFVKPSSQLVDLGNSGTSLRIFTALAATANSEFRFDGDNSLRTRPMGPLLEALAKIGVKVDSNDGKCPIKVQGPVIGGETNVDGNSSQFLSALLIASPLAPNNTVINVYNLNEIPYVEMTLDWLRKQNIHFETNNEMSRFEIFGGQTYTSFDRIIPADFSTATFPLTAAAVTKGSVKIKNLDFEDSQGDKLVFEYFERMGADIRKSADCTSVSIPEPLRGVELDLNSTPDALPAMAVAASFAKGTTKLLNVPQARIKETDRIDCMTKGLRSMGVEVEELVDGMVINGTGCVKGASVDGCGDHRLVMAFAIAGLGAEGEMIIEGGEAAAVTYPDFINDFKRIGANIEEI